jgi:hypothetical protein
MEIKIKNLNNATVLYPYDFKVDITSALGNPFPMKNRSEKERIRVCEKYDVYFRKMIQHAAPGGSFWRTIITIQEALKKHDKVRLFCWCYPKRCHAETIRSFLLGELT